jgi:hypothetical protein
MPQPPALVVVANPFCALDDDGDPSGAVTRSDIHERRIGATLDTERSKASGICKYTFTDAPETLPDSAAHRSYLRSGEVIPADEATAALVSRKFVPVADVLAAAKARAIAEYRAAYGVDPACAKAPLQTAPATPTPAPSAPAAIAPARASNAPPEK